MSIKKYFDIFYIYHRIKCLAGIISTMSLTLKPWKSKEAMPGKFEMWYLTLSNFISNQSLNYHETIIFQSKFNTSYMVCPKFDNFCMFEKRSANLDRWGVRLKFDRASYFIWSNFEVWNYWSWFTDHILRFEITDPGSLIIFRV